MRETTRLVLLLASALATIGCDQATKYAASHLLVDAPDQSHMADVIRLGYTENTAGFLSLGADLPEPVRTVVFTVSTGVLLAALLVFGVRHRVAGLSAFGLALFIAGGFSNLVDRVVRGSVIDFLNVGIGQLRTGVFNVADVAIMGARHYSRSTQCGNAILGPGSGRSRPRSRRASVAPSGFTARIDLPVLGICFILSL